MAASPVSDTRNHGALLARPAGSRPIPDAPRKPLLLPALPPSSVRLREAPVSPVRVNVQRENWPQPSNADIELAQAQAARLSMVDDARLSMVDDAREPFELPAGASPERRTPTSSTSTEQPSRTPDGTGPASAIEFAKTSLDLDLSPTTSPSTAAGSKGAAKSQVDSRNSRESDLSTSSGRQRDSDTPSVPTSASSLSGANDTAECPPSHDNSPPRPAVEGSAARDYAMPLFQYHHQQLQDVPPRVNSVPHEPVRSVSNPDHSENGSVPPRRHLTPTSGYWPRGSLSRPQSSYSSLSDMGPRGRSPNLLPGAGSHMRAPSTQSRKSPDTRPSSYAELLNVPYPQQAPPAALSLDNSNLRNVVGNNASLLSVDKTLEMYRQNVKKTNDCSIQYSFAVFLVSLAQEQGFDLSDLKPRKGGRGDGDMSDVESPVAHSTYELVREARQILQRLANGGYPFAQYYLADGHASGLFSKGKEDHNSAFPLFVLAAKHGHAESAYRTALCYEFGWGCRKDPAKAVQFLRSAASKRHPGAMTRLGKACLSGDLGEKRYREGIKWMKLAAEAADAQYNAAPYQLGCLYETGYGDDIFQDLGYAAELFTQAAELGHPEANFRMGEAYEHGRLNCPRDPALSVHFYTGAAEGGHAAAMMGLCAWYMVGAAPILDKDEEEAYEWARRSAELGFAKAQYAVGYFTESGIGCRRDMLEANVWYVKAADAGDERAKQRLSVIQAAASGKGVPMEVASPRSGKLAKGANKDDKECVVM
ncbi:hypothetical protein CP532_3399 [Ophiocordyceps camponoti-leonardi (nom. inval.)]|nr:hypothetical protein CP532_3399 [Ophiocordyceps camponoti-leonardi (nom. inval.)]